jgi:UDP-hydrolysing UDP-N-acetyl-D-glucosamine 2-epimerase
VYRIGVVTVGRSDLGILRPVLCALDAAEDLEPALIVSGAHLGPAGAVTRAEIAAERQVAALVDMGLGDDSPRGVGASMGRGVERFAALYAAGGLDAILLLGDRFEMLAAAAAAVPFPLPLVHVHGGEISEGAFDDRIRHALTKLAHLHFVATERSAARVRQMGEEDWRVSVSGAPALDALRGFRPAGRAELERRLGITLSPDPLLVTLHPATLEYACAEAQAEALVAALTACDRPIVVTAPNADPGGQAIAAILRRFVSGRAGAVYVESLGQHGYFSMMRVAAALVGNSSSGLIEAPSFGLPVVNIGSRQRGRERAANVLDVAAEPEAIRGALARALDASFRAALQNVPNPFGDGRASERIAERLPGLLSQPALLWKRFV